MRVTTGVKIAGTKSFRLSCSMLFGRYGTNLQNPTEDLLECCIPDEGKKFVQRDQAGAESLIVAYEAEAGRYRELFTAGIKPHVYIALHLFIDEFRQGPKERYWFRSPLELKQLPEWKDIVKNIKANQSRYDLAKRTNHARSYRMRWPTFRLNVLKETEGTIVLSKEEAQGFLNTWDELFPEVVAWQESIEAKVKNEGYLTNLFGFPRSFYRRITDEVIREAISWIPQSTVGCITHYGAATTQNHIEDNDKDWDLLNNKHDSLLLQVPEVDEQESSEALRRAMEIELTSHSGTKFTMRTEASAGWNWKKFSPDNPRGMKEI